jgi:hypothetical protein
MPPAPAPAPASATPPLPPEIADNVEEGYQPVYDPKTQYWYFWNAASNQVTWEKPLKDKSKAFVPPPPPGSPPK